MLSNLNDKVREELYKNDTMELIDYFNSLSETKKENIIRFLLLDYYKIDFYNNGNLKINNNDIDNIILSCSDNYKILYSIIDKARIFNELDYFSKCLIIENMGDLDQDRKLFSINKLHFLDKLTYKIYADLDLYKKCFSDFMRKNKEDIESVDLIQNYFTCKLIELRYTDENKYKKFVLEFIKIYYKWKKFIKEHEGEYLLNEEDFFLINKIETENIDILYKIIENNFTILSLLIMEYLHYSTETLEIEQRVIDNYFNNSTEDKVKNKLKIKEKESQ